MKISSLNLFKSTDQIAWVGAGGKTSLIFSIAQELFPDKCVISTTTKMSVSELINADHFSRTDDPSTINVDKISGISLVYKSSSKEDNSKIVGFSGNELRLLSDQLKNNRIPFFIEADGSKRKSFKFPAEHEPNIPDFVNKVCVVAGLSIIGKPLRSDYFHRVEEISAFLNVSIGEIITFDHIYKILLDTNGGLKNIPQGAEKIIFLNQSDCIDDPEGINKIALQLKNEFDHVLLTRIEEGKLIIDAHWGKIGCVILAAGTGSRFGGPKQLANYKNKTFIQNVIERAIAAPFSEVAVILGAFVDQILPLISGYKIKILHNDNWQVGQSTSVKLGVEHFSKLNSEAIVFLLVDQPQINSDLITNLLNSYAYSKSDIIVHDFNDQTRHPILFSKNTFEKLLQIKGEKGGRQIFDQFRVNRIKLTDPIMAIDIDTLDDLNNFN